MEKKKLLEWAEILIEALIISAILFFLCWPVEVVGSSMESTLFSGDRLLISRAAMFFGTPERGEVVVTQKITDENLNIVKRVIGIPGDHIVISNGTVYLNGEQLDEPYISGGITHGNIDILLLPEEYFVMGDNRETSVDSRTIGVFLKSDFSAKIFFKWYPFNEFGKVK